MNFIGENLFPGQLGHFCAVLSFAASLVAMIAFFKSSRYASATDAASKAAEDSWKRLGRIAFITEVVSVLTVIFTILYLLVNHKYEYYYAWNHSSNEMQARFLVAAFWESSEGSFLLWTFWNAVLGLILMKKAGKWEAPVLTVISFAQFCLASMILGIYFFDAKLGSSPFILLREFEVDAPIFKQANYMTMAFMQDGRGLNPLLQNYWMVIHPPVLFLGFSATIVPFAYAIAALWRKEYTEWTKVVLPWASFAAAVLGLGIMMGAAWAYESLSFGGFWAWDPVENAILVPWIVMVSGIHTLLAYKSTGHSLRITFAFFILSFLLILYSTFLTRSGILGDTSVHSFTDLGMNTQLLVFLLLFVLPSFTLFIGRYKFIPSVKNEENVASREFWMFVGALLLFLSSLYVTAITSIPVYNKVFGQKVAPPEDNLYAYNKVMILVLIVVVALTAITQYFKYKQTSSAYFWKKMAWPAAIAAVAGGLILYFAHLDYYKYGAGYLVAIYLGLFFSIYAVIANAAYIWVGLRGKMLASGASVAHVGFGLLMMGALIATSKKKVISENTSGISVPGIVDAKGKPENPFENLTLVKGLDFKMGDYRVTYVGDSAGGAKDAKQYYRLHFTKGDREDFSIYPDAFVNVKEQSGGEGIIANPDYKRYLDKDVFVYLTSLPNKASTEDTSTFREHSLKPGDTLFYSSGLMVFNHVIHGTDGRTDIDAGADDSVFTADITVHAKDSTMYKARPTLVIKDGRAMEFPDTVMSQSLVLKFSGATKNGLTLKVKESNAILDYVTIKSYIFPYINLVWLGTLVMVAGFLMSVVSRVRRR